MYDALFQLDKGISERFTTMQDTLNGVNDRITTHEQTHNREVNAQAVDKVISREIKLDAKKAGVGAVIASAIVVLAAAVKQLINNSLGFAWW